MTMFKKAGGAFGRLSQAMAPGGEGPGGAALPYVTSGMTSNQTTVQWPSNEAGELAVYIADRYSSSGALVPNNPVAGLPEAKVLLAEQITASYRTIVACGKTRPEAGSWAPGTGTSSSKGYIFILRGAGTIGRLVYIPAPGSGAQVVIPPMQGLAPGSKVLLAPATGNLSTGGGSPGLGQAAPTSVDWLGMGVVPGLTMNIAHPASGPFAMWMGETEGGDFPGYSYLSPSGFAGLWMMEVLAE